MKSQNSLRMKLVVGTIAAGVFFLLPTHSLAAAANCDAPGTARVAASEACTALGSAGYTALPASQFFGSYGAVQGSGCDAAGPSAGTYAAGGCSIHSNSADCDPYGDCDRGSRACDIHKSARECALYGNCSGQAAKAAKASDRYADCFYGTDPYSCPDPASCGSADCQREACSKVCAAQGFCDCSEAVCQSNACKSLRGRNLASDASYLSDAACNTGIPSAACTTQPELVLPDAAQPFPTARPTATPNPAAPAVTPRPTAAPTAAPTPEPTAIPTPTDESHYTRSDYAAQEAELLNYVNQERTDNGLAPLERSDKLTQVARLKSWDMAQNNYFDHQSPTLGGMKDLLASQGVAYTAAGENIAHYGNIYKAHNALMASEGHRRNILSSAYTQIGIGVAVDRNGNYLITEEFLRP